MKVDGLEIPDGAIIFTDLDDCIIGLTSENQVVYSHDLLLEHFIKEFSTDEDPYQTAIDWISYNVIGTKVENGPIVMYEPEI